MNAPDLEIRVTTKRVDGETRLSYVLRYIEGKGEGFDRTIEGAAIRARPEQYQARMLSRIEKLGSQLGTDGSQLTREDVDNELEALGHDLYKELFSPELRTEYRRFRNRIASLLIISDEPWIPWELVKPHEASDGHEPFDDDFLCFRFELTRWLTDSATHLGTIATARLAAIEAGAPQKARRLRHAAEESQLVAKMAERHAGIQARILAGATYETTTELLRHGGCGVLLFVGHGEFSPDDPNESRFLLVDGRPLRPLDLHGEIERQLRSDRPLVFFNSCQVAQQGFSLTRLGGWAARWVRDCGCGYGHPNTLLRLVGRQGVSISNRREHTGAEAASEEFDKTSPGPLASRVVRQRWIVAVTALVGLIVLGFALFNEDLIKVQEYRVEYIEIDFGRNMIRRSVDRDIYIESLLSASELRGEAIFTEDMSGNICTCRWTISRWARASPRDITSSDRLCQFTIDLSQESLPIDLRLEINDQPALVYTIKLLWIFPLDRSLSAQRVSVSIAQEGLMFRAPRSTVPSLRLPYFYSCRRVTSSV